VQKRYASLGAYVRTVIERDFAFERRRELTHEHIEFVQVAALIFVLQRFLEDGSHAAQQATENFAAMGIGEFTIGAASFSPGNPNVLRGQHLARQLLNALDAPNLKERIESASTLAELIRGLMDDAT
jgi:hypothetical protein